MNIFDPHCHMISRVTDDYERMALCGIRAIVEPAFWLGEPRKHAGTYYDYFDHICNFERQRAAQYLIDHYATIAVNPRESNHVELRNQVLKEMPKWLSRPSVVAVGEIGFDDLTAAEDESIRKQFEIARQANLPVLVHTPHVNKLQGTIRTIEIIRDLKFPVEKVILDHNTEETIAVAKDSGCWCGHTIYPVTKLSPERAVNILEKYGLEKMLINSSCDWGPSDPLMVPKTVLEMRRRGFSDEEIAKVVWENPIAFFKQSGRLSNELLASELK
ncbi:MAG: TatD family hydrolase [Planctomycetes bacterium]|nr:TatD family hydrolase [Planctomycetota bacterium]